MATNFFIEFISKLMLSESQRYLYGHYYSVVIDEKFKAYVRLFPLLFFLATLLMDFTCLHWPSLPESGENTLTEHSKV